MYKKSLLALATLGVFAGGAVAADVSLYGVLDQGFAFKNLSRNSPYNAKHWVGMDSEPSFSSAIFALRCISL